VSSNKLYTSIAELPAQLPIFPLTGATLLPGTYLPLNIFEPRYLQMVDECLKSERLIGMIQPKLSPQNAQSPEDLEDIGCAGRIIQFAETGDGRYRITLYGIARFLCQAPCDNNFSFRIHNVDFSTFTSDLDAINTSVLLDRAKIDRILDIFAEITDIQIDKKDAAQISSRMLVNSLATIGNFTPLEKQALLKAKDIQERADLLYSLAEFLLVKKVAGKDTLQ
jgi:uncharacterized protein